jgi:hypothetical protein
MSGRTSAKRLASACFAALVFSSSHVAAQNVALLLFDAETSTRFAGCLNCGRYDDGSVCNKYGDFGSKYADMSIWNKYGNVGSKYEDDSPWNKYGEGLIVVDNAGNFYGQFTMNHYARWGQSEIPMVQALLDLYDAGVDLDELRDLLCEQ